MNNKNLVYFILTYKHQYIPLFSMLLEGICKYNNSKVNFDIMIITHQSLLPMIKSIKYLSEFNYEFMLVPDTDDLYTALKYKANIFDYPNIFKYDKVLFLDVDIIVQNSISKLFDEFKPKDGILYAIHEQNGTHYHRFWSLIKYSKDDIKIFNKKGIVTFNSGTMMFKVSPKMEEHFRNLKKLIATSKVKNSFYDQSYFNHYFNKNLSIDTDYLQNKIVIFPISNTYYPYPTFLHFAGIGNYAMKTEEMSKYLKLLTQKKHKDLLIN